MRIEDHTRIYNINELERLGHKTLQQIISFAPQETDLPCRIQQSINEKTRGKLAAFYRGYALSGIALRFHHKRWKPETPYIMVYVHPACRRRHIGTQLYNALQGWECKHFSYDIVSKAFFSRQKQSLQI